LHPAPEGLHAVALALKARDRAGQAAGPDERVEERSMGLEEAVAVRALWRRQRELERVLEDRLAIEPVKAEALRELEAIADFMRKNPWRSRDCAQKCGRAVSGDIQLLVAHLAGAVDAGGNPQPVLQAFGRHLHEHLLMPSDGGGLPGRFRGAPLFRAGSPTSRRRESCGKSDR